MDFDLTEDQKEIKRVARELLGARSPWGKVREAAGTGEYDDALWRELVELGWPGIAVAPEHGGQGLGAVELAVLAEELGYACAATPLVSAACAAAVIQAGAPQPQRERWLTGILTGEVKAGIGTQALAIDAAGAQVVAMIDGDDAYLLEDPDAEAFVAIDPTRRYATVDGAGIRTPLAPGSAARVRAALAAEVLGICQRALEMTVAYVRERKQFGVPVGSFQAVSHRCAQMLMWTESLRSAAYFAAWAAEAEPQRLVEAAGLAAAAAIEAAREVTASAIQAHGGIGFTWEADVHWLYKRAQLDATLLGSASAHRAALARISAARVAAP